MSKAKELMSLFEGGYVTGVLSFLRHDSGSVKYDGKSYPLAIQDVKKIKGLSVPPIKFGKEREFFEDPKNKKLADVHGDLEPRKTKVKFKIESVGGNDVASMAEII